MRLFKRFCGALICLLSVTAAGGQSESDKWLEVFAGFTRSRSDLACCRGSANGFHVGVGYSPIRFLLLGSEFSHAFGPDPQYVRHLHVGPQLRFQIGAVRPFGRVMAGFSEHCLGCFPVSAQKTTRGFSMAVGGGVDLMVHPRAGIRAFSLDRIRGDDYWDTRASFGAVFLLF